MWLSAPLDLIFLLAAGVVWPSTSLLWRVLSESSRAYQQGCTVAPQGQAQFEGTKGTICWAFFGYHECSLLGVEMELRAALWPAVGDVGEEPWTDWEVGDLPSPAASLWGEANAAEATGTRKTGISISFILCCISAYSGLRDEWQNWTRALRSFPFPTHEWGEMSTRVQLLQKGVDPFPMYSTYLYLLILFFTCDF